MRQLGQKKRQKFVEVSASNELWDVETHSSGVRAASQSEANYG
ncbi:hypothetical protein [Nodularia sp. NIES-3585]|nr:hypothetical protein [Nodularia sp. NIES-3585]GAX35655.1 hypothetical protein NIES3585_16730 [Nodularia sp. NIES-3585]